MTDDSAEIFFQSFLACGSGMGKDVHSLMLSIQRSLCRPRRRPPSKVTWRMVYQNQSLPCILYLNWWWEGWGRGITIEAELLQTEGGRDSSDDRVPDSLMDRSRVWFLAEAAREWTGRGFDSWQKRRENFLLLLGKLSVLTLSQCPFHSLFGEKKRPLFVLYVVL